MAVVTVQWIVLFFVLVLNTKQHPAAQNSSLTIAPSSELFVTQLQGSTTLPSDTAAVPSSSVSLTQSAWSSHVSDIISSSQTTDSVMVSQTVSVTPTLDTDTIQHTVIGSDIGQVNTLVSDVMITSSSQMSVLQNSSLIITPTLQYSSAEGSTTPSQSVLVTSLQYGTDSPSTSSSSIKELSSEMSSVNTGAQQYTSSQRSDQSVTLLPSVAMSVTSEPGHGAPQISQSTVVLESNILRLSSQVSPYQSDQISSTVTLSPETEMISSSSVVMDTNTVAMTTEMPSSREQLSSTASLDSTSSIPSPSRTVEPSGTSVGLSSPEVRLDSTADIVVGETSRYISPSTVDSQSPTSTTSIHSESSEIPYQLETTALFGERVSSSLTVAELPQIASSSVEILLTTQEYPTLSQIFSSGSVERSSSIESTVASSSVSTHSSMEKQESSMAVHTHEIVTSSAELPQSITPTFVLQPYSTVSYSTSSQEMTPELPASSVQVTLHPSSSVSLELSTTSFIEPSISSPEPSLKTPVDVEHKNISFEIKFKGVCEPLIQEKIVLGIFWEELVISLSRRLQVDKSDIKPKDIACHPVRISFLILDTVHTNISHELKVFVASKELILEIPVRVEDPDSFYTYEAVSVKQVPLTYDIGGTPDMYELGLNKVDIIVIIAACCVSVILICIGCCICLREYYIRKRSRSFDLSDIVNFNLKLEDYTLTKIPRTKPFYADSAVKMQSFTRKSGQQTKSLLEQEEKCNCDDTIENNGAVVNEVKVRMNTHSDGIVIGVTATGIPDVASKHATPEDDLTDQSKDILYENESSPTHCMDNPIYYADDDRFTSV